MRTTTRTTTLAATAALALAGCTSASTGPKEYVGGGPIQSVTVTTESGREVECIVYASKALSCDWARAEG